MTILSLTGVIMGLNPKTQIELFHLMFLRQFSAQINANLYGVKGGCNLRFFFGSARYSEDLGIDVCKISPETLENKVSKLLASISLKKLLRPYGISQLDVTSPKQTPTTQRWKIQIHVENASLPFHTKIEFSRRNEKMTPILANISREICQTYRLPPMRLAHYGLEDAITQKIIALGHRLQTQSRDVFDLYHLLHIGTPNLSYHFEKETLNLAEEALLSIDFGDYRSQVVNFLEPEEQKTYDDADYWSVISNHVLHYLNGLDQ
jgi:predicted nucleotidyltransferase component of viral defense system